MGIQQKIGEAILNVAVTSLLRCTGRTTDHFLKRKEFTQSTNDAYESGPYSIRLLWTLERGIGIILVKIYKRISNQIMGMF